MAGHALASFQRTAPNGACRARADLVVYNGPTAHNDLAWFVDVHLDDGLLGGIRRFLLAHRISFEEQGSNRLQGKQALPSSVRRALLSLIMDAMTN